MEYINGNEKIEYEVIYKNNKNMYLRVRDKKVIITAPYATSQKKISSMIAKYYKQIIKRLNDEKLRLDNLIFGNEVIIEKAVAKRNSYIYKDNYLLINYKKEFAEALEIFYKDITRERTFLILERMKETLVRYGLSPNKFSFKKLKTRWGSCKCQAGDITINTMLGRLDENCLRYVICHELAHLKHPDHSKSFYAFLYLLAPDYQYWRKYLKKYVLS